MGSRTERSQEVLKEGGTGQRWLGGRNLWDWEVLAIVGLAAAVVFSLVAVVSLVRHVRRLKHRLRRSAEVLAPSGGHGHVHGHGHGGGSLLGAVAANGAVVHLNGHATGTLLSSAGGGHIYRPANAAANGTVVSVPLISSSAGSSVDGDGAAVGSVVGAGHFGSLSSGRSSSHNT